MNYLTFSYLFWFCWKCFNLSVGYIIIEFVLVWAVLFSTTRGYCWSIFHCFFPAFINPAKSSSFKGTTPSYLSFFSYRLLWTKSSSYIIAVFDEWANSAPLLLQIPLNGAKIRCCCPPCIWLITASKLRKLLCLVPLLRKTMSIKCSLVI